ncbi:MAG: hypothetical protein ACXVYY_16835 [Oryzihumus sp.]
MMLRAQLASHLGSGQVSRVVYGSIIGLAVVLTLQAHPPGVGVAIGTLLSTALAVALAELYSELVGARARSSVGSATEPVATMVGSAVAVAFGIAFPSLFFVAVALNLVEYDTAFSLAKWTGLGLIAGYGYLAARLSGTGTSGALLQAVSVGLIAAVLIALKALVH